MSEPGPAGEGQTGGGQTGEGQTGDSPTTDGGPALLHGCPVTETFGQRTAHTDRSRYLALMEALYRDGFEVCIGVCGVDYLTHPGRDLPAGIDPERFEVVVELLSLSRKERLRVRCQVPGDEPVVPSLFDLWPGSEAHERETFDMFGDPVRGPPGPDPYPDARRLGGPPVAQGLPGGERPRAVQGGALVSRRTNSITMASVRQ